MNRPGKNYEGVVVVVGAGAAGQSAAVAAAEAGADVVLLEQASGAGRKILASGGGRCNLTNHASPAEAAKTFGRQGRFVLPAMEALQPGGLCGWMDRLGTPTVADEKGRVFPASQKSADVQAALHRRLGKLGVELRFSRPAERLWIEDGTLHGVELHGNRRVAGECVVLACGGRSWLASAKAADGYTLARQAGHDITPLTPALVPLVTRETWPGRLAGVSLSNARVHLAVRGQSKAGLVGDVLFTHKGLSGPAILDISGAAAEVLARGQSVPLRLEFLAGLDAAAWSRRLDEWRTTEGRSDLVKLLRRDLPASLSEALCELAGLSPQTPAAELSREGRGRLSALLGGAELAVVDTEGFQAAFVTRGGVSLRDVAPDTLQSRLLPGLFFAGEMLDLDGPTGGYNLCWAFSSGLLAGRSAAGFVKKQ
ncbi:MAG: aminoacetone oxidase family FAD-binding enzyme [Phycisphaerae bacterium]|nr:aminoacetone oxidase family FAD-binding enzyme [Phycisphaerae bacterium]